MTTYTENFLKIENSDYDLNTLFNFQASFEQLKFVLSALATSQKKVLDRVANMEKSVNITNVDDKGFVIRSAFENIKIESSNNFNNDQISSENNGKGNNHRNEEVDKSPNNINSNQNVLGGEVSFDFLIVIFNKFKLNI